MKKKISLFAALLMVFLLAGCGRKTTNSDNITIRVGSLKGPTTIGLVNLMEEAQNGNTDNKYDFRMAAEISEITAGFAAGDFDIALVPANAAAMLYNKTDGNAVAININTEGVLYLVTGRDDIKTYADLDGETIITTGQGATPEYCINYLNKLYGVNPQLEFMSEATEVAARLNSNPQEIAILPQPFATVVQVQNDKTKAPFSLSEEWNRKNTEFSMITGVTIVNRDFLEKNEKAVRTFIEEAGESASKALADVETTAALVVKHGIIEKEPIAVKALPKCSIVSITGEEMKKSLEGYLNILYNANKKSVGGVLPEADFYYTE